MTKPIIGIDAVGDKRVKATFGGTASIGVATGAGNGCVVDVEFGSLVAKATVVGLTLVGLVLTNTDVTTTSRLDTSSLFDASTPTA